MRMSFVELPVLAYAWRHCRAYRDWATPGGTLRATLVLQLRVQP